MKDRELIIIGVIIGFFIGIYLLYKLLLWINGLFNSVKLINYYKKFLKVSKPKLDMICDDKHNKFEEYIAKLNNQYKDFIEKIEKDIESFPGTIKPPIFNFKITNFNSDIDTGLNGYPRYRRQNNEKIINSYIHKDKISQKNTRKNK